MNLLEQAAELRYIPRQFAVFILWDRERHCEEKMSCCTKQLGDLFLDWTWASRTGVERANHQTIKFPSGYIDDLFFVCFFFLKLNI